jgi:chromosome segregation ATPase
MKRYLELDAALRKEVFGNTDSVNIDAFFEINLPLLPDVTELITSSNRTARALADAQHLAISRYEEIERLYAALTEAQQLATSRFEDIKRLSAALAEAQQLATSRFEDIGRLNAAFTEAQQLATSRFEDIERLNAALTGAHQLVTSRFEDVERLSAVLNGAQQLAASCFEDIEGLCVTLTDTQQLASARFAEVNRLRHQVMSIGLALDEATKEAFERTAEIDRLQQRVVDAEGVTASLADKLVELEGQLSNTIQTLDQANKAISQRQLAVTQLQESFDAVLNSKSWRWTKGFRSLSLAVRILFSRGRT